MHLPAVQRTGAGAKVQHPGAVDPKNSSGGGTINYSGKNKRGKGRRLDEARREQEIVGILA